MKSLVLILALLCSITSIAQRHSSDEMSVILSIKDDKGQPLANQEIVATNVNSEANEGHRIFTKSSGRATFILRRGETYNISFLKFKNFTTLNIPLKGMNFLTKKIIYPSQNTGNLTVGLDTIIQNFKQKVKPTKTEALLTLLIKDKKGKRISNRTIWLIQPKIKKAYQSTTNKNGAAAFLLPINYEYDVNFENDPKYRTIKVPNMPFLTHRKGFTYLSNKLNIKEFERNDTVFQTVPLIQKATKDRVLLHVTVLDLDDVPLENESVFMVASDKVYTAKTNADGQVALMLPKGKMYTIRFEYSTGLEDLFYEKGSYTRKDKVRYKYIGSAVIKARERERARMAIVRDSLMQIQAFRDSLNRKRSAWSGFADKMKYNSSEDLKEGIYKRVEEDSIGLAKDPKYFETIGDEVAATLHRNKDKWKNKIIVTDLTCSMYPYMDQILVWHVLELHKARFGNEYLFFNDGDGKSMKEKILGKTGGFHYLNSKKLEDLTWTMLETMKTGCSIDGPENDLEALLESVKYRDNLEEIILIADNSSPVRDIELLTQLNVPIRIILTGVWYYVNEEYLEIAFKTKGSVHTLDKDIDKLYELNDGEYLKIGDSTYRVYQGKFVKMDRL